MARGVDEVQGINLSVVGLVGKLDGGGFDGDAPLPLQIHGVQDLVFHFPLVDGVALLQQAVCQGGFAVVDVGDDGEIADFGKLGHRAPPFRKSSAGKAQRIAWHFPNYTEFFRKSKPYVFGNLGEYCLTNRTKKPQSPDFLKNFKKTLAENKKSGYSLTAKKSFSPEKEELM